MRNTGFASMSGKSPDVSLTNDKGALLPTSTKASSEDSGEAGGDTKANLSASSIQMSARHLPPVYVDI